MAACLVSLLFSKRVSLRCFVNELMCSLDWKWSAMRSEIRWKVIRLLRYSPLSTSCISFKRSALACFVRLRM